MRARREFDKPVCSSSQTIVKFKAAIFLYINPVHKLTDTSPDC